jgi:hypothetical protein
MKTHGTPKRTYPFEDALPLALSRFKNWVNGVGNEEGGPGQYFGSALTHYFGLDTVQIRYRMSDSGLVTTIDGSQNGSGLEDNRLLEVH